MKKLYLILVLAFCTSAMAQFSSHPSVKSMGIMYGCANSTVPAGIRPQTNQWMANTFTMIDGCPLDLTSYVGATGAKFVTYIDTQWGMSDHYWYMLPDTAACGYEDYESSILHTTTDINYSNAGANAVRYAEAFDVADGTSWNSGYPSPTQFRNGILLYHASAYSDKTQALYQASSLVTVAVGDYLYIGYFRPYDRININIQTARVGGSAGWQYYNGSIWTTLTLASDTTSGLTASGLAIFVPPSDWAPVAVNGSRVKFWTRVSVASVTTAPVLSKVFGDDWALAGCTAHACTRGFNPGASGVVTVATSSTYPSGFLYNPSPPAGASARFLYQSRYSGYGGFFNRFYPNPGSSTYSCLKAHQVQGEITSTGIPYQGVFHDNAGGPPSPVVGGINYNHMDLPCAPSSCTSSSWENYFDNPSTGVLFSLRTNEKSLMGSSWVYDANPYTPYNTINNLWTAFDGFLQEQMFAENTIDLYSSVQRIAASTLYGTLGGGTYGSIAYFGYDWPAVRFGTGSGDNGVSEFTDAHGIVHLSDQAQRLPMAAMAQYYSLKTAYSGIVLNRGVGASYGTTDEYYVWRDGTTTTSTIAPATYTYTSPLTFTVVNGSLIHQANTETATLIPGWIILICPPTGTPCDEDHGDLVGASVSGNTVTVNGPVAGWSNGSGTINQSYPTGVHIKYAVGRHQAVDFLPTCLSGCIDPKSYGVGNIWYWGSSLPVWGYDVGGPDPAGWNGGNYGIYLDAAHSSPLPGCPNTGSTGYYGLCSPYIRRDYIGTNGAIKIFWRPFQTSLNYTISYDSREFDTYGTSINLVDSGNQLYGPYCVLQSDGSCSGSLTSLSLRGNEAAILVPLGSTTLGITGPSTCPNGYQNSPYAGCSPAATGGVFPYSWDLSAGSLPTGLSQNPSTGAITGTPTVIGPSNFTVRVTDSTTPTHQTATKNYTPTIFYPVLTITTASCPDGQQGVAGYACNQTYAGGDGSNTWTVSSGALPGGLGINPSTGAITGTPSASGTFAFTVQAADGESPPQIATHDESISISVPPSGLIITSLTTPLGFQNSPYSATMTATGGVLPYSWSVPIGFGSCPAGLNPINPSTGVIAGTPTAHGTCFIDVEVTDAVSTHAFQPVTILIDYPVLTISGSCQDGVLNSPYTCTLTAVGGNGTNTWSVSAGALPDGLLLSAGVISGTPSRTGSYSATVRVSDTEMSPQIATTIVNITINSVPPPPVILNNVIANNVQN